MARSTFFPTSRAPDGLRRNWQTLCWKKPASPAWPALPLAASARGTCASAWPIRWRTSTWHWTGLPPGPAKISEAMNFRVYATCHIGDEAENVLRQRKYQLEIYHGPEPPPKKLIIEKVKQGIDGLITTLRDPIDAEVFEAGKGRLKVVAQIAVGFDNINRADANRYKVPFTHTADVLTDATAEFAFFIMGAVARKLWSSEREVRDQRWGAWHPFLPFLGDEVSGKTIAIIGTGRIGQAMIRKATGFDMDMVCYDPAYHDEKFVQRVQLLMDFRQQHGLQRRQTSIRYASFTEALREADFVSVHVPLIR